MTRTSLLLPPILHQRLQETAKQEGKSLSELVRGFLEPIMQREEQRRLDEVYRAFHKVQGICKDPISDASTTIDEILYGKTTEEAI